MGESLIGRLKGVLAKKPATEASVTEPPVAELPALEVSVPDQPSAAAPEPPAPITPKEPKSDSDQLVAIEFRALLPNEAAAREIAEVSRRGSDCVNAATSPSGRSDLSWQVLVTLDMIPKPEAIRDNVELVALFSSRLGGRADGWQMRERPNSGYLT
jgi:Regulator of ribonuclease activity B